MGKNGCTRPFDELQIVSWFVFPLFVVAFGCLVATPLPFAAQLVVSIFFGTVVLCLFLFAAKTTLSDSGDPQVYYGISLRQSKDATGQVDPEHNFLATYFTEGSKKCHVCKVYRQPLSEHCRICNKCVETFDHHCKWLNTCIGSQNYRFFFLTLTLATTQVTVHFFFIIGELIAYGASVEFRQNVEHAMRAIPAGGGTIWLVLQIIVGLMLGAFAYLLADLWKFHIRLIRHDDTTFGYLKNQQRRDRLAKEDQRMKKKQQQQSGGSGVSGGSSAVFPAEFEELQMVRQGSLCSAICFPCVPSGAPNKMPLQWTSPEIRMKSEKAKEKTKEKNEKEGKNMEKKDDDTKREEKVIEMVEVTGDSDESNRNSKQDLLRTPKTTTGDDDGSNSNSNSNSNGNGNGNSGKSSSAPSQPVKVEFSESNEMVVGTRVTTILGILGTVCELRREKDSMLVVKLDWKMANGKNALLYTTETSSNCILPSNV